MARIPRSDFHFKGCTKSRPCPTCGANTWCFVSACGDAWGCRRQRDGAGYQKTCIDGTGQEYHLYFKEPPTGKGSEPTPLVKRTEKRKQDPKPVLPPDRLGAVYSALHRRLTLDDVDRASLLEDLTQEEIDRFGFRSLPSRDQVRRLSQELMAEFGDELLRVPGFFKDKAGVVKMVEWSAGWLFPYHSDAPDALFPNGGEPFIAAFRIRWRKPRDPNSKYAWLSSESEKYGGVGPDSIAEVMGEFRPGRPRDIYLCEGEKKAIVAARQTLAVCLPGVSSYRLAESHLLRSKPDAVVLTFDADREIKKGVAGPFVQCYHWLTSKGYTVKALRWWGGVANHKTIKGYDDAVKAGCGFETIEESELETYVAELTQRFGLAPPKTESPSEVATTSKHDDESQVEALFRLAGNHLEFFRGDGGRLYFAHKVRVYGGHRVLRADQVDDQGRRLTDALRLLFYEDKGWPAKAESLRSVADILRVEQQNISPIRRVSQRVQEVDGAIYIDLNDGQGNIVRVTGGRWELVQDCPARFLRRVGQGQLPVPEHGGSVEELFRFLNVQKDCQKQLAICFVVQSLLPRGPYPLMVLEGEQGSGKTSCARVLSQFIDPLVHDVGSIPSKEEEFAVQANASHLLVYDNVSKLPAWLPDLLCKSSTGGAYSKRQLHTDADLFVLGLSGPVILTGIGGLVGQADLLERVAYLPLERFGKGERKTEEELRDELEAVKPRIFGALLDVLAKAVAIKDQVTSIPEVRLPDFAKLSIAVGRVLGWDEGFFEEAFVRMQRTLFADSVESSPVVAALVQLLEQNTSWCGTWRELLQRLKHFEPNHHKLKTWPAAPNSLSRQVNRAKTVLREIGYEYEIRRRGEGSEKWVMFRRASSGEAPPEPRALLSNGADRSETPRDSEGDQLLPLPVTEAATPATSIESAEPARQAQRVSVLDDPSEYALLDAIDGLL